MQNVTKEFLCFEKMIPLDARIGGIVLVDADLDSFYFEDDNGVNTVNVLTSTDAFTKWKLPNKNYTRVGVTLKKYNDTALKSFDKTWSKYVSEAKITLANAFAVADDVLRQGVQSISDLILLPGIVNLDFADVTAVMKDAGYAHMGVGRASGKDKAETAANMAISSPLLETAINGAKGVIINITSSPDIGLDEVETASAMIAAQADKEANIIWGAAFDEDMEDEMSVTVIATGFATHDSYLPEPEILKNAAPAPSQSQGQNLCRPQEQPAQRPAAPQAPAAGANQDDDDTFYDIMSIFNRK